MVDVIFFLIALLLLAMGANWLVKGASGLALLFRLNPVIIGLTIVSLGTSAPEILVTTFSTFSGDSNLALGNVIGSNICNTFLILGVSSILRPIPVQKRILKKDLLVMVGATIFTYLIALKGNFSPIDGIIFLILATLYFIYLFYESRSKDRQIEDVPKVKSPFKIGMFLIFGLVLLLMGADWLVDSALSIADKLGVSSLLIGLTIVALGTSLPELALSIAASLKRESDLLVGNVIGSNVINLFIVLGLASLLSPTPIVISNEVLKFDFPFLVFSSLITLPVLLSSRMVHRLEGFLFLCLYAGYILFSIEQTFLDPIMFYLTLCGILFMALLSLALKIFWERRDHL